MSPLEPRRAGLHSIPGSRAALTPAGAARAVVWLALAAVTGCTVGPDYRKPDLRTPSSFTRHEPAPAIPLEKAAVEPDWWRRFGDPVLDELVATATERNHDLRIARARLLETRALWTTARLNLAPAVRFGGSYEDSQTSRATRPDDPRHRRHNEVYRFGFDATWELDLWGRVRRDVEAARATVQAVEADRDDLLVVLRAEVASEYIALRGAQSQLEVARRNATNQSETLRLAEALRDGGQATQLDVARAKSQLSSTLAVIPALEAATDHALHRLAALCAWAPAEDAELLHRLSVPGPLPEHRVQLDAGDPAALLRRRPDLRRAERELAAAAARIGVDVADLFPRVTLQGDLALEANRLSRFSGSGLEAWGFGPRLSWPAFDLSRVRQRIRASEARAEGALARYEQTVLLALQETADHLVSLRRERERLTHLTDAEAAATEAVQLARQRFRDGIADFLSVLDAERTALGLQEQLVASRTRELTEWISVYKALGGGWTPADATGASENEERPRPQGGNVTP